MYMLSILQGYRLKFDTRTQKVNNLFRTEI